MQTTYVEEKPTGQKVDKLLSLDGGAITPFAIASISGLIVFILVMFVVSIAGDYIDFFLLYKWQVSSIASVLTTGIVWWGELSQRRVNIKNSFIQIVERMIDEDINGGGIGESPDEKIFSRHTFLVSMRGDNGKDRIDIRWETGSWWQVVRVAKYSVEGRSFSELEYLKSGDKFMTAGQYRRLRKQFINQRVITKTGYAQNAGYTMTQKGIALCEKIILEANGTDDDIVEGEVID